MNLFFSVTEVAELQVAFFVKSLDPDHLKESPVQEKSQ